MYTVKSRAFLRIISVFCIVCAMLSFSFYTGAKGISLDGVFTDENGLIYRLDKESLCASLIFGAPLKNVSVPEILTAYGESYTVTSVEQNAFAENDVIESIVLPDTVTHIGDKSFFGCVLLGSVKADGLLTAGCDAFSGTPFIKAGEFVVLGEVLLRYNGVAALVNDVPAVFCVSDAFSYNSHIKTVILPNTVVTIGNGAFALCESLKNVSLPFSVEKIGDKAFFGCVSLNGISVAAGVKEIGESAFSGTPFLSQLMSAEGDMIVLGDGVLVKYKGDSENVTVPSGIRYISDAFAYTSVKTVSLPSGCSLGTGAFRNASRLYRVRFNGNLSDIGNYAFSGCSSLEILAVRGDLSGSIGFGAFDGTPDSITAYFKSRKSGMAVFEAKGVRALSPTVLTDQ